MIACRTAVRGDGEAGALRAPVVRGARLPVVRPIVLRMRDVVASSGRCDDGTAGLTHGRPRARTAWVRMFDIAGVPTRMQDAMQQV